ncbi:hypothetical protein [Streptomyces sp. NPDC050287]|uniref:hypothetical protein n=1 Tax=Streptomyces sp. NPDC050287 TaxID=3365608 RepID=UPI0037AA8EE9
MTVPLGLGIVRLVFRALNLVEALLAAVVVVSVATGSPGVSATVSTAAVVLLLDIQLAALRPALNRRSDRVPAGEELPRSRAHLVYIGLDLRKTAGLIALGTAALAAA